MRDDQDCSSAEGDRVKGCLQAGKAVAVQSHRWFVQGDDSGLPGKHRGQGQKALA